MKNSLETLANVIHPLIERIQVACQFHPWVALHVTWLFFFNFIFISPSFLPSILPPLHFIFLSPSIHPSTHPSILLLFIFLSPSIHLSSFHLPFPIHPSIHLLLLLLPHLLCGCGGGGHVRAVGVLLLLHAIKKMAGFHHLQ
jgi:hypothetical protein